MKKTLFFVAAATMTAAASAQDNGDSLRMEKLQEVVVSGVRTQKDAPYATSNIRRQELAAFSTSGQELPFLFARTPGVLAWSENGLGTGTTYMRIRGAGDSRINVTLDGVPLNSPEDQCVFWANTNSYAALLGSVQVQRGVGTSTNGDGAFGGTIAMGTKAPATRTSAELSASIGSYGTVNVGGSFSTGAIAAGVGNLFIDGAYHQTTTDGYLHGTDGRSGSYYGALTWQKPGLMLSYKNIGNFETTGQAWNGVTAGSDDYSLMDGCYDDGSWAYQTKTGITTYADLYDAGLGKYNSLYEHLVSGDDGLFLRDANGHYITERYQMSDGSHWPHTTDNFWQNHNLLTAVAQWADSWQATATLHYTHGYGYYDEFRWQNKLKKFGLNVPDIKRSDFVRRKGLRQDVGGIVAHATYSGPRLNVVAGLSAQHFWGEHFGYLTYASHPRLASLADPYHYYDSDATKLDASAYVKAAYRLGSDWQIFADVQYRHVDYTTDGINDKFYDNDGFWYNQQLDIDEHYNFFNPKGGISYSHGPHHAYASVAVSHREPERNNFTDNYKYPLPRAERLTDYEAGYNYSSRLLRAGVNVYYMDYTDQFVQTGELSEIGEPLTTNIADSYRLGAELTASLTLLPCLTIEGNAAISQNKLKDFTEMASENWDDSFRAIHYDDATLAFSPSLIANAFADFHWRCLQATWHTGYVSRQYLDNTECRQRSLPAYSTSSLRLAYTLRLPRLPLHEAVAAVSVSNIFDSHYAASGWVYSSILDDYGHPADNRYYQIGFIPMAGRTFLASITLRY